MTVFVVCRCFCCFCFDVLGGQNCEAGGCVTVFVVGVSVVFVLAFWVVKIGKRAGVWRFLL